LTDGDAPAQLDELEWLVGTGRWEAICSARTGRDGAERHITIALKVIAGNWQVVYEHEDPAR
jgi:hypothetical protein